MEYHHEFPFLSAKKEYITNFQVVKITQGKDLRVKNCTNVEGNK